LGGAELLSGRFESLSGSCARLFCEEPGRALAEEKMAWLASELARASVAGFDARGCAQELLCAWIGGLGYQDGDAFVAAAGVAWRLALVVDGGCADAGGSSSCDPRELVLRSCALGIARWGGPAGESMASPLKWAKEYLARPAKGVDAELVECDEICERLASELGGSGDVQALIDCSERVLSWVSRRDPPRAGDSRERLCKEGLSLVGACAVGKADGKSAERLSELWGRLGLEWRPKSAPGDALEALEAVAERGRLLALQSPAGDRTMYLAMAGDIESSRAKARSALEAMELERHLARGADAEREQSQRASRL
jgi:hypothetical protein